MFKETVRTVDLSDHAILMDCYMKLNVAFKKQKERIVALEAANRMLEVALRTVGDDYPGSSCQQFCHTTIDEARAAMERKNEQSSKV